MKLGKLMDKYEGEFIQLHVRESDTTTRIMTICDLRHDCYVREYLVHKVVLFTITHQLETNAPVLWVEIL